MPNRTVFFISDGTGITAETFGNAILAQFELQPRHVRLPFVDTPDKAHQAVRQINHVGEVEGKRPIVFTTLVDMAVLDIIRAGCKGMLMDMFGMFVQPLEHELAHAIRAVLLASATLAIFAGLVARSLASHGCLA